MLNDFPLKCHILSIIECVYAINRNLKSICIEILLMYGIEEGETSQQLANKRYSLVLLLSRLFYEDSLSWLVTVYI